MGRKQTPYIMTKEGKAKCCPHCGVTKLVEGGFYTNHARPGGYSSWCRECVKAYAREYRRSHPGSHSSWYYAHLPHTRVYRKLYMREYRMANTRGHTSPRGANKRKPNREYSADLEYHIIVDLGLPIRPYEKEDDPTSFDYKGNPMDYGGY